ncbi:MATE family efflux transporter [Shewanella sp. OPT22]|nr:MATE family efflux transporter [Shewanella sp. OPT22]
MSRLQFLFSKQQHHRLWSLAIPIIISNISVPLIGLIDTAMIGHLSAAYYLGGVALGSTIISMISWLLGFLRMSTTGLTAQASGKNDHNDSFKVLIQSSALALILACIVLILQTPILNSALWFADASKEVIFYCKQYIEIRIWSLPFVLVNMVMLGWLLGQKLPKVAMWQVIIANVINLLLDIWFIIILDWKVEGAAWASLIADMTAFVVALIVVLKQCSKLPHMVILNWKATLFKAGYIKLISLNTNIFIRSLCLQLTLAFMTFYAAKHGDNVLAANAILLNLLLLISYGLDGIAYYAEVEVGNAYSQKKWQRLNNTVWMAWFWSGAVAALFALIFFSHGDLFIEMMTNVNAVIDSAKAHLFWLALMPLWAYSSYLFDGVFIGASKGSQMRNSMLFSTIVIFFPTWYLLQDYDNHALWAALSAFMFSRSATLGAYFIYSDGLKNAHSDN